MELSGKLSNALHLQQQTRCGGEWRSLPWAAKNGKSARADNLDVSLESLYPPQFNDKFCKIHCGPCPAQAVARGVWAWLHTQPAPQLGQKERQNCFSTLNYCFPGAGQVFEDECSSGWAILKDVFPASCRAGGEPVPPHPCSRAWPRHRGAPAQGQTLPPQQLPVPTSLLWVPG